MYEPPRSGATLWEIGVPDRTAEEFYIPDPNPTLKTHSYKKHVDKLVFDIIQIFLQGLFVSP